MKDIDKDYNEVMDLLLTVDGVKEHLGKVKENLDKLITKQEELDDTYNGISNGEWLDNYTAKRLIKTIDHLLVEVSESNEYIECLEKENQTLRDYAKVGWDFAYKLGNKR